MALFRNGHSIKKRWRLESWTKKLWETSRNDDPKAGRQGWQVTNASFRPGSSRLSSSLQPSNVFFGSFSA